MHRPAIAIALLLALAGTSAAQLLPEERSRHSLTIITPANWKNDAVSARLVDIVTKNTKMNDLAKKCNFSHVTSDMDMYRHRWSSIYPPASLPIVILQESSGEIVYKASGANIPQGGDDLYEAMRESKRQLDEVRKKTPPQKFAKPEEVIVVDPPPDTVELLGGQAPVRNALGLSIILGFLMFGIIVMLIVLNITWRV
jgi:hypothetical protein